jgi:hypothetical protein
LLFGSQSLTSTPPQQAGDTFEGAVDVLPEGKYVIVKEKIFNINIKL